MASSDDVGHSNHSAAAAAAAAGDGDAVSLIAQLRAKCEQLRQKCDIYEHEVNRLSGKLERFIHEVRVRQCIHHIIWLITCFSGQK